jgi:hypothetical protein
MILNIWEPMFIVVSAFFRCFKSGMCEGQDEEYRNGYFRGYFEQMNI